MTGQAAVIATAGHVDHGKSTLVTALTGVDPDRLAEEKRRGLTIELGFAPLLLRGAQVAIVDVPGHERFLPTMLAGVAVIDAVLLCVDTGEGWRQQSEEHLRIVDLIGVDHGVVAMTKSAGVGYEQLMILRGELTARLAGTGLAAAPVVACDAVTGAGLAELRAALDRVVRAVPPASDEGTPRLWIDRSFAVAGAGAVVTGGVAHGSFATGDEVQVVGGAGARSARIRQIQGFGQRVEETPVGGRAALNLAGVSHHNLRRGDAVVRPGEWAVRDDVEARVDVPASVDRAVTSRGAHLAYLGTEELAVRLDVVGARSIEPGTAGTVRLRLPRALPLRRDDRLILRDAGRSALVGGGVITSIEPRPHRGAHSRRDRRPSLMTRVTAQRPIGIDVSRLDDEDRRHVEQLVASGSLVVTGGYALAREWAHELEQHPYLAALRSNRFAPPPPSPEVVDGEVLRALARRRLAVQRDGAWFAREVLDDAVTALERAAPEPFTVAQARQALGTTRRFAVPLLELLDAEGLTVRQGDGRRISRR